MTDVLIGQVGDTHDGALLDGPGELQVFFKLQRGYLITPFLIALLHRRTLVLDLFEEECALEDIHVVLDALLHFCIFQGSLPHTEDIVLLNVPDTAFGD